ncbi:MULTISPECIES: AMP-binding protein [Frankia]|nr:MULTISPECIES: AMP-binding protein [Frankia]
MTRQDSMVQASRRQYYLRRGWWDDTTLGQLIDHGLTGRPDTVFRVWSRTRPYSGTYRDVRDLATRVAGSLHHRNVRPGDPVIFHLPNWLEAAVSFAGLAFAGAVAVPVPHYVSGSDLGKIARLSRARVVITSGADPARCSDVVTALRSTAPSVEHIVVVGGPVPTGCEGFDAFVAHRASEPIASEPIRTDPDQIALLAFTSGTGSAPKGVVHTHRSLCAEVRSHLPILVPSSSRPQLTGGPISHAAGMLLGLLLPIHRGQPVNLMDTWDPADVFAAMDATGLSAGTGAVYFLASLLDSPDLTPGRLAQIDSVVLGASPVPTSLARRAGQLGIDVVRSYGLTEHPTITGAAVTDPADKRETTDGRPLPGVELKILRDSGETAAPGEAGEVCARGPDLMTGYLDPELNAELFDADGWLRTGDIGFLDAEGWLTITGRSKDLIIRNGVNISPGEIENVLLALPGVVEAAVIGMPDESTGERAHAVLRLRPGATRPDLEQVRRHLLGAGLTKVKWPEGLHIATEFPRTPSGKVQKFLLRRDLSSFLEPTSEDR